MLPVVRFRDLALRYLVVAVALSRLCDDKKSPRNRAPKSVTGGATAKAAVSRIGCLGPNPSPVAIRMSILVNK